MFSNRIQLVPKDELQVDRDSRQRTDLTQDSILDLAYSIGQNQWISPLLVNEENNFIIAGERRFTAICALAAAVNGDYSGFSDENAARTTLFPVCTCKVDSWHNWTRVPVQYGRNLTERDIAVYEFIENVQREDLSWQDRAKAIYTIHAYGLQQDSNWSQVKTAQMIGAAPPTIATNLKVWRTYEENQDDTDIRQVFAEANSLRSAAQALDRFFSRRETDPISLTNKPNKVQANPSSAKRPGPAPGTDAQTEAFDLPDWAEDKEETESQMPESPAHRLLLNKDFTTWAATYSDEPFNFIHCDFPYGISFNKGEQAQSVSNTLHGEYDDSEEVYWKLLETLAEHRHKLVAESAHIMFWFSQNLRRETEDFFINALGATIQSHLLIWHCSDQDGIVPDTQRYGRRTYETALVASFGDRKIVAPRALSFSAPRGARTRVHRSQKSLQMLEHFFSMFVDSSSRVLDPTAGSGTSLLAAQSCRASHILGLETDPKIYINACDYINDRLGGVSL